MSDTTFLLLALTIIAFIFENKSLKNKNKLLTEKNEVLEAENKKNNQFIKAATNFTIRDENT